jgi:phenylalanyl-tRNA synthetase alpha chain
LNSEPEKEKVIIKLTEDVEANGKVENTITFANKHHFAHEEVVGVAKSLTAQGKIIMSAPQTFQVSELSPEGKQVLEKGSPEFILFQSIPENETKNFAGSDIGLVWAIKNKWVSVKGPAASRLVNEVVDDTWRNILVAFSQGKDVGKQDLATLKKRKWVVSASQKYFSITKGLSWGVTEEMQPHLSAEQIVDGSWEKVKLKPLNFDACGLTIPSGFLHPLMKVREEFRQIFLELGYEEMKTNKFVESSFWNFDSLFQPQQHPARDSHDTFFISQPEKTLQIPDEFYKKVKEIHENGGYGSIGWRYKFSDEEPRKNVLRTHTTACSSRTLYALAQQPVFTPKKYFSIDRVYRNETLDYTHLAEFHQIEGFIADYNISLSSLMGAISEFYKRIGITQLKFKPAYNPYTEPSMEIFGYSPERKSWMEIGNSGIFRPEMLLPLGLPPEVGVAAWGLSLERPTMIKYHLSNIRELVGHKVNLDMVSRNPFCMFDSA